MTEDTYKRLSLQIIKQAPWKEENGRVTLPLRKTGQGASYELAFKIGEFVPKELGKTSHIQLGGDEIIITYDAAEFKKFRDTISEDKGFDLSTELKNAKLKIDFTPKKDPPKQTVQEREDYCNSLPPGVKCRATDRSGP